MLRRFAGISVVLVLCLTVLLHARDAFQGGGAAIPIDPDDIAGVVTGPRGPEAGVWVIAETSDLPTKFVRIVVTDDAGAVSGPGSAEGELPCVDPRLWAGGLCRRWSRSPASS